MAKNKKNKSRKSNSLVGRNPCAKKSQKPKHLRGFGRYPRMVHCSRCRQIVTTVVKRKHNSIFSVVKLFVHHCPNCQRLLGKHVHSMIDYCPKCPHCKRQRPGGKRKFGRQPQKVHCSFCQQFVTSVTEETNGKAVFDWCIFLCCCFCCCLLCILPFLFHACKDPRYLLLKCWLTR
uniref:LITAF domain-containing protein n=1 Tax=Globodera rostochiensis TaxID=31243 RepID=A0A914IFM2_GLORO